MGFKYFLNILYTIQIIFVPFYTNNIIRKTNNTFAKKQVNKEKIFNYN